MLRISERQELTVYTIHVKAQYTKVWIQKHNAETRQIIKKQSLLGPRGRQSSATGDP